MYPLANAYKAQLINLPYAAADTAIEVNHATDLPDPATDGAFNLVIWNRSHGDPADAKLQGEFEIVKVTAIAGTTLTVERAQEGTTALELTAGGNWQCVLASTAKYFADLKNEIADKASLSGSLINAKNIGAKGDGVTDDSVVLQDAADALKADGGGTFYFPDGVYITDRIFFGGNIHVKGAGPNATTIKLKPAGEMSPDDFGGVISARGTAEERISGFRVSDLTIDGNKENRTWTTTPLDVECVEIDYCDNAIVENLITLNSSGDGVDFDECKNCIVSNVIGYNHGGYAIHPSINSEHIISSKCLAINCGFDNNRGGFDTYLSTKNCKYVNCHAIECKKGFIVGGAQSQLTNCSDLNCDEGLSVIWNADRSQISQYISENSGSFGVNSTVGRVKLSDIEVYKPSANAITISGNHTQLNNFTTDHPVGDAVTISADRCEIGKVTVTGLNGSTLNAIVISGSYNGLDNLYVSGYPDNDGILITGNRNTVSNIRAVGSGRGVVVIGDRNIVSVIEVDNAVGNAVRIEGINNKVSSVNTNIVSDGNGITISNERNSLIDATSYSTNTAIMLTADANKCTVSLCRTDSTGIRLNTNDNIVTGNHAPVFDNGTGNVVANNK